MAGKQTLANRLDAEALALATQQRLLRATDWIEKSDLPLDKAAWRNYRDQLACTSSQSGWPHRIVWPEPPRRP